MEIKEYRNFNKDEIANLYKSVGWINYVDRHDMLEKAYENSLCILGAFLKAIMKKYKSVYQMELLTDNTEKTVSFYKSVGFRPANEIGCLSFIRM